jgi:hypothetical protein
MLETLNSVPWSKLEHAYGEASDVPDLIRALASPEQKVYAGAISRLWSSVIHQGTVYSATASVVPFFCELLEAPEVHNKAGLLDYLAAIAHGASYGDVHIREPERRGTPEMQQQIAEELSWVQAASDAVSEGYATYLRLLQSSDPQLRAYAAHTLSCCQSHAAVVVPEMKQHLAGETSPLVGASLLLSLGLLLHEHEETTLFFARVLQETQDPLIQVAAAMGTAFALKQQTSQQAVNVLIGSYELPLDVKARFSELPFAEVDLDACISLALRCIGLSVAPLVMPTLLRAVRRSNASSGLTLVPNLLYFAFGEQKITRTMTVSHLTDLQRDALSAVYETEALWGYGNMAFTVGSFFDPKFLNSGYSIWDRKDLGAFLAGQNVFRN